MSPCYVPTFFVICRTVAMVYNQVPKVRSQSYLPPGPERHLHHVAMELAGSEPLVGGRPGVLSEYLYSRAASIAGGTSEIQRTIIAERILHLPRGD
jgi:hypothetical protein